MNCNRGEFWRFLNFLAVGLMSTTVSLASRYILNFFIVFEASVGIAHVAGMIVAFALNRLFVFPATDRTVQSEFFRFFVVNTISLTITTLASMLLYRFVLPVMRVTLAPDFVAHFCGLAASTIPSYLGHKYYSFGSRAGDR